MGIVRTRRATTPDNNSFMKPKNCHIRRIVTAMQTGYINAPTTYIYKADTGGTRHHTMIYGEEAQYDPPQPTPPGPRRDKYLHSKTAPP